MLSIQMRVEQDRNVVQDVYNFARRLALVAAVLCWHRRCNVFVNQSIRTKEVEISASKRSKADLMDRRRLKMCLC